MQLALLFLLLMQSSHCWRILKEQHENCSHSQSNMQFWQTQKKFYKNLKTSYVKVFKTSRYDTDVNVFADDFLKKANVLQGAIFVSEYNLFDIRQKECNTKCWRERTSLGEISRNLPRLNFVIAANLTSLLNFESYFQNIFSNQGGIYTILFVDGSFHEGQLRSWYDFMWSQHKIMNVLMYFPCSQDFDSIYYYNPFGSNSGSLNKVSLRRLDYFWSLDRTRRFNMKGFNIKVAMFTRIPTAITNIPFSVIGTSMYKNVKRSNGYAGLDGFILSELSSYFNFTISMVKIGGFGSISHNGTYTGAWKEIFYRNADMAGNSRFIEPFDAKHFAFTTPVDSDLLCIVVPKSEKIPNHLLIFYLFKKEVWIVNAIFCLISILFWIFLNSNFFHFKSYLNASFEIVPLFFSYPVKIKMVPSVRWFLGACLLNNLILNGILNGALMMSLSKVSYYPEINTLEDLSYSGLPILTNQRIFSNDNSSLFKNLAKKVIYAESTMGEVAFRRDVCVLERKKDACFSKYNYKGTNGVPLINVVEECPILTYLAYLVSKDFPFLNQFDFVLGSFRKAGLLDKWYGDTVEMLIADKKFIKYDFKGEKPFSMSDMQLYFYAWIGGVTLSILVFLLESAYSKYQLLL